MKRERFLRRRLETVKTLSDAVSAMRSLSAHHFRLSRRSLPAARAYRAELEESIAEVGVSQKMNFAAPAGILLVVSDLGLCGDYNNRLVQAAVEECVKEGPGPLYCVGRRPRPILARHGIQPKRMYNAPTSVDGLPSLLLQLAQDMLDDLLRQEMGSLFIISARFEGAGRFTPVVTQVLPVPRSKSTEPLRDTRYVTRRRLAAVAIREFLYSTLYELLLDSLASEHSMRLLAAESAKQWLDETSQAVRRQLSACRREASTQEVLDIVAGSRSRPRRE